MTKLKLGGAALAVILVIIVFLQNQQPVEFRFLFFAPIQIPKTFLILGAAVFGALVTLLVEFFLRRRQRTQVPPSTILTPQA